MLSVRLSREVKVSLRSWWDVWRTNSEAARGMEISNLKYRDLRRSWRLYHQSLHSRVDNTASDAGHGKVCHDGANRIYSINLSWALIKFWAHQGGRLLFSQHFQQARTFLVNNKTRDNKFISLQQGKAKCKS